MKPQPPTHMRDTVWIVVSPGGFQRAHKTKNFTLDANERAFELQIIVPTEAFATPPVPVVRMEIPASSLMRPVITISPNPLRKGSQESPGGEQ